MDYEVGLVDAPVDAGSRLLRIGVSDVEVDQRALEGLVLPDREVEGDPEHVDAAHGRVVAEAGVLALGHAAARRLHVRGREAEEGRLVVLGRAGVVFELDDDVDHDLGRRLARRRLAAQEAVALGGLVRVDGDVAGCRAGLLLLLPLVIGRLVGAGVLLLQLVEVAVDVTRRRTLLEALGHVAPLQGHALSGGASQAGAGRRAAGGQPQDEPESEEDAPHAARIVADGGRNMIPSGLDMAIDLQAAADEYLGWLQLEANRSPNTVRAYGSEIRRLAGFLAARGHSLQLADLRHEDLRAYQRHLAGRLPGPA